jgi:hypothetical protein
VQAPPGKGIRNVFQEDQSEHDVFVLGGAHVAAELIRRGPYSFLDFMINHRNRSV